MAHHTHGMTMPDPRDPPVRDHAVLPGYPDANEQYRATPESIARAKVEAAREREAVEVAGVQFQIKKEQALNTLTAMVNEFGYPMVQAWLTYVSRAEAR